MGTGNYNPQTARIYVDLGLLTDDPDICADVTDLFNVLTGVARQRSYRKLLVAPTSLREGLIGLIEAETERHRRDGGGRIIMKINACVDPAMVVALYKAAEAGVSIDLIVRGMCSLMPGQPNLSETIRVRSVVGRFLEHSRIIWIGSGEAERFYIGSADLMERNLDRRIEAMTPVEDPVLQGRLREIIAIMLADDRRSWQLGADGEWRRTETIVAEPTGIDTFETLMAMTRAALETPG